MGEIPRPDGFDFQVPESQEVEKKLAIADDQLNRLNQRRRENGLGPEGTPLSGLRSSGKGDVGFDQSEKPQ